MKHLFLLLSLTAILFFSYSIQAQITININPVKDNTLYENSIGSLSNGSGTHFLVGKTNQDLIRRGLLKFDIAGNIPTGASILQAYLTLSMDQTSSGSSSIELHTLTADWGEGASVAATYVEGAGAASQPNDATWLHSFYNSVMWSKAGGDFSSLVSATTPIIGPGNYNWTSTQLIADVQSWLNVPSSNFGWCLIGDEVHSHTAKRFASREAANPANRPVLSITYMIPVSVQEKNVGALCSVFPNPSDGLFKMSINKVYNPVVRIYNAISKMVYSQTNSIDQLSIDLRHEPAGTYFYELLSNNRIIERGKMIIRK